MLLLERLATERKFEVVPEDFQQSFIYGKAFKEPSECYFPSSRVVLREYVGLPLGSPGSVEVQQIWVVSP